MAGSEASKRKSKLRFLIPAVVGLFAVAAGIVYLRRPHFDETGPGRLLTIHQLALADGKPVLLLVEQLRLPGAENDTTYERRLDVVDPVTGKRFVRETNVDAVDCIGASPGRIWCDERGEKPALRDLATLKRIAGDEPFDSKSRRGFGFGPPATIAGDKDLGFAGPGRQSLVRRSVAGADTPVGTATYVDPSFLADGEATDFRGAALVLDDNVHVVTHVDNGKAQLTAIDAAGAARWHVEIGQGRVMRAWRFKYKATDLVIVALQAEESHVIAIDPKNGQIAWRYDT